MLTLAKLSIRRPRAALAVWAIGPKLVVALDKRRDPAAVAAFGRRSWWPTRGGPQPAVSAAPLTTTPGVRT